MRHKKSRKRTTTKLTAKGEFTVDLSVPNKNYKEHINIDTMSYPDLADLISVFNDLVVASLAMEYAKKQERNVQNDIFRRRACWDGAIISYGRCFKDGQGTKGKRLPIEEWVQNLSQDEQKVHQRILLLRDQRVAHHVADNSGQSITIVAGLSIDPFDIIDVYINCSTPFLDKESIENFDKITIKLREFVGREIDKKRKEISIDLRNDIKRVEQLFLSEQTWSK